LELTDAGATGRPRALIERPHLDASPQLVSLAAQQLLAVRDHGRDARRTGLYLARLPALSAAGAQKLSMRDGRVDHVRVGRADGIARPALEPCMGGLVVATPRTYAGDYFVGINWLDAALQKPRREQQFYEDARAFTQAAVACLGTHALVLVAEHPQLGRDQASLRAVPYRCE
jgi:hypothetical protein